MPFVLIGTAVAMFSALARADSLPVTPPGNQVLWLAADSGVSTSAGNVLTSWYDASGNGFDWLGGSGGNAGSNVGGVATLTSGSTNSTQTNSVPLVNLPGIYNTGLVLNHTGDKLSLTTFSVYMVLNTTQTAAVNQTVFSNFGNPTGYAIGTVDGDPTNAKFYTGAAGSNINAGNGSFANDQYDFLGATIDSSGDKSLTTAAYGTNPGVYTLSNTNTSTLSGNQYVLGNLFGGFQAFQGNIAEVLVYDDTGLSSAQISQQQTDISNYLDAKYFSVPEPASLGLLSAGLLGLALRRNRK